LIYFWFNKTKLVFMELLQAIFDFNDGSSAEINESEKIWTVRIRVDKHIREFIASEPRTRQFVNQTRAKQIIKYVKEKYKI
jgi:hypothetical protein